MCEFIRILKPTLQLGVSNLINKKADRLINFKIELLLNVNKYVVFVFFSSSIKKLLFLCQSFSDEIN